MQYGFCLINHFPNKNYSRMIQNLNPIFKCKQMMLLPLEIKIQLLSSSQPCLQEIACIQEEEEQRGLTKLSPYYTYGRPFNQDNPYNYTPELGLHTNDQRCTKSGKKPVPVLVTSSKAGSRETRVVSYPVLTEKNQTLCTRFRFSRNRFQNRFLFFSISLYHIII